MPAPTKEQRAAETQASIADLTITIENLRARFKTTGMTEERGHALYKLREAENWLHAELRI